MFCPNCGKDNANGRKFCASCGTNLETISQALSGSAGNFFSRTDAALDQFIARYSEHVFKDASTNALDRRVRKSWQVLGQGILASFVDLLLFILVWNIFPIKFFMLLIRTPIQLLFERSVQKSNKAEPEIEGVRSLPEPSPQDWLPGAVVSVTEQTTVKLVGRGSQKQKSD